MDSVPVGSRRVLAKGYWHPGPFMAPLSASPTKQVISKPQALNKVFKNVTFFLGAHVATRLCSGPVRGHLHSKDNCWLFSEMSKVGPVI